MTFSDALPVQFWLADCDTFNEKEVDGVFPRCFCQPFNCDDPITVQFRDTTVISKSLFAINEDGDILFEDGFLQVASGLYQLSFTPRSEGICNEQIQLIVAPSAARLLAPTLWTDLNTWSSKNATQFVSNNNTGTSRQPFHLLAGKSVSFDVTVAITSNDDEISVNISFLDIGLNSVGGNSETYTDDTATGTFTIPVSITAPEDIYYIEIQAANGGSSTSFIFTITIPVGFFGGELAKSDCLDIKENHEETVLINYTNNRIFASINPSVGTPDPEFNLRIPAIFFHERYPRESESIDLSDNSSLQLNAQIKKQRRLDVKHMPDYMHLKTILALSFSNVTIDGVQWKLDESYDKGEGNRRFPLKSATTWLTQKNYLLRNVL